MSKLKISEDWTSTIVGWFIILLVVFQLKPHWPSFSWPDADALMNKVFTLDNVGHALIVFCFMFLMALIAGVLTGKKLKMIAASFPVVFFLTLLAMVVSGNKFLKEWGFETVIFSLLIGLFISNIFSIPRWLKESLSSELFVKIGLVLLGTSVLFDDLLKAGSLGLIQSCVVVFTVWNFCFWLCRKMKIPSMTALLSTRRIFPSQNRETAFGSSSHSACRITRSCRVSGVSCGWTGTAFCRIIAPPSGISLTKWTVAPVTFTP